MRKPKTVTIRPMTRAEWEKQPAAFKYFHPWERASKPLKVTVSKAVTQ